MKEEILAAVMFLVRFIEKSETFPRDQLENFKNNLTILLTKRFEKHWFPEVPAKGQGYRCIRVNGVNPVDMTLEKAAVQCGLSYRDLRLPTELTVWVDPSEVCYRLGESEGSYCTLATFPSDATSPTCERQRKSSKRWYSEGRMGIESSRQQQYRTGAAMGMSALRMRQMASMPVVRGTAQWQRCDRTPHLQLPAHHSPYHYPGAGRYMPHHRNYKNVVTV